MKKIVSFSGGKDSTALLLRLLEERYPVDDIIFFDTGWEFPEITDHVHKVQEYIGREITILHPEKSFEYWMLRREVVARKGENKGEVHRIGNGWPSPIRRWCTSKKVDAIDQHIGKDTVRHIGIAADEAKRTESRNFKKYDIRYPLIDWDMAEADCLKYCYDRGFNWDGLYEYFDRVSCFCCPLQRVGDLRTLRIIRPELWQRMLDWEIEMEKTGSNRGFRGYKTVHDLDRRFAAEDMQMDLFE